MNRPEPKQQRSRETQEKILEAADKLFSKKGYNDVNSNMIAVEAGVSVGSFYNYYDDKKDVLLTVLDRSSDYMKEEMKRTFLGLDSEIGEEQLILEMVKMSIRTHKKNAGLMKMVEALRGQDPDFEQDAYRNHEEFIGLISAMLSYLEKERGLQLERIETKAKIIMSTVEGLCHECIFYDLGIDEDVLALELTDLIMKYLQLDSETGDAGGAKGASNG